MCGIAGIFHYADPDCPIDRGLLERMTRSLAHRGPDAEDFYISGNVGFGHRRLSIVDLSPTGAQPMPNDDRTSWITYNGEFYNHRDFRPRLAAKGARFRGPSDTETLLRLMDLEGPESLAQTSGIFAFAFWDRKSQTLTLGRDHLGVKQLYFHDDGRRIIFASEIKALLHDPTVPREIDPEGVNQYIHFHAPLFERTFFRGIHQIRAGQFLRVHRAGVNAKSYWSLTDFNKSSRSENEQIDDLKNHLTFIVGQQLMSDVPVGSFFSGGIDSSAVAAHASVSGKPPMCFGVHFTDQGVTDERPYQEAAAKALGLELHLITMDGDSFPDDFRRLMYHQDQPVLGPALFPMAKVSELAARHVKVCLGGQAADEIFGGYARYALGRPLQVIRSWFAGRQRSSASGDGSQPLKTPANVGGNLSRQFAEGGTLFRLARNARYLANWEASYFEHFAKVPESDWQRLFAAPEFCNRDYCRQIFNETVHRSPAKDPLDKIMFWDVQTYMTGLFQQDDRMSMASGLESRVPFADPRLVQAAFQIDGDLKLRGGASKWILRQAVADILPPLVLNRRKVGFDTPAARWLQGPHASFARETLLSTRARQRGLWDSAGIADLLEHSSSASWFDMIWKVLSIEQWATIFLDEAPAQLSDRATIQLVSSRDVAVPLPEPPMPAAERLSHIARECRELGVKGTLARGMWEIKTRSGILRVKPAPDHSRQLPVPFLRSQDRRLPFTIVSEAVPAIRTLLSDSNRRNLADLASGSTKGQILCFSHWMADYGNPIDWHRDPTNGHRWGADTHWSSVLRGAPEVDVKFAWEAARFPHAYQMARTAALDPGSAAVLASAFESQVRHFITANPPGLGVHWFSGQEVALRIFSWLFGIHVFSSMELLSADFFKEVGESLIAAGIHLADHIEYARDSVYNNHLLSEALGLYIIGRMSSGPQAKAWAAEGFRLLDQQADQQIYPDGGYIQQGHNYHRVALQLYVLAWAFAKANGDEVPKSWLSALERSLDFLLAHQNESDGALPNYGANDGSLPILLAQAELPDFRPILQTISCIVRQERVYGVGPWDEMAIWFVGPQILDYPLRKRFLASVSFQHTGYHVLRGTDPAHFAAFRCGTILDRFSQIDMLHLDVWWRGQNVLIDPGSYRYNGAPLWHNHFLRTESHNTVMVDGRDQMLHFRQFKTLYWTEAKLLRFEDSSLWTLAEGEHYGYKRSRDCVHRRAVLMVKDGIWIVVDTVLGKGEHSARLQWLAGDYPYEFAQFDARVTLQTPNGPFSVSILDMAGQPCAAMDVVRGSSTPPRGWQSRFYGMKSPSPSIAGVMAGTAPIAMVTVLCGGTPEVSVSGGQWRVGSGGIRVDFQIQDGRFAGIEVLTGGISS